MPSYASAILFHGPGARTQARHAAHGLGRVLREFGEGGLKIAESREIIGLMSNAPVGDEPGVIVVGPVDYAAHASTDVLLKTLEEFNPDIVRPVLWAHDETEVSPTIRSRCLRRWCPGEVSTDDDAMDAAREIVYESFGGHRASVIEMMKDKEPRVMLECVAKALAERGIDDESRPMWDRVRSALSYPNTTFTEALAALL